MNYKLLIGILIIIIIILLFTPHQKERFNSNNLDLPWSNTIVNTDFVKPLKTNNISISVNSKKGDRIIIVTSINGINIGDTISINPGSNNSETKTVVGTGNSLLYLDSNLEYTHLPNEPIHNNSNPNENNVENNTSVKKYAEINDQGLLQFEPSEIRKFIPYNSYGYCSNSNVCSGPGSCRGKDQNPGNGGCNHYCPGGEFYRSDLNGCVSDYCIKPTLKSCKSGWFYVNCPSQTCNNLLAPNYVNTLGGYKYTYDQAKQACQKEGARLCSISEINNLNICSAGWTSNKIRGYPMANGIQWYDKKYANPRTRYQAEWCGPRSDGWRTWSTDLNNKGSAHCCKKNTNI